MTFGVCKEKVTVRLENNYQFAMTSKMSMLLVGFGGKKVKIIKQPVSPYVVDVTGAMNATYVCCHIVQPQVI